MPICSALNAVRSRRPPLPAASSGLSGPPSSWGRPAVRGRSPAPGDGGEGERGQPGPGPEGWAVPPHPAQKPRRQRLPAAGDAAKRSLLLPPFPELFSLLPSLRPGLEPEEDWRPAAKEGARRGVPCVGLLGAWLLWDSHSTENGALVILPCFGAAGKEAAGEHDCFIPQAPQENVVCVNTHQRAR